MDRHEYFDICDCVRNGFLAIDAVCELRERGRLSTNRAFDEIRKLAREKDGEFRKILSGLEIRKVAVRD